MTVAPPAVSYLDFIEWENELAIVDETLATLGVPQTAPDPSFYAALPLPAPVAPSWVPIPDNPTTYSGPGSQPKWEDVFNWYVVTTHAQTPDLQTAVPTIGPQVAHAIDVANGQTIKALSGFINQSVNLQILASTELANRITDVENVLGAVQAHNVANFTELHNVTKLLADGAIPELWAQVRRLDAGIISEGRGVLKLAEVWTTDNIFKPLDAQLLALKATVAAQPASILSQVPGIVRSVAPTLGLASAAALAATAAKVATLEAESAACTQPMCNTLGPLTGLGKLLKAIALAGDLALLADFATMKESDLVSLITNVAHRLGAFITDIDTMFVTGGDTLADFITHEIGSYV